MSAQPIYEPSSTSRLSAKFWCPSKRSACSHICRYTASERSCSLMNASTVSCWWSTACHSVFKWSGNSFSITPPHRADGLADASVGLHIATLHSLQVVCITHQINAQLLDGVADARVGARTHFRLPFCEVHRCKVW